MKDLTKKYWKLFKKDGVLFEELTGQILKAKYPDIEFKHTGGPYDGGKDFEAYICNPDKKIEFWAECKYYQSPLPIHNVSMSMTMAVIEKINKIIFFSYSSVNRNFNKYIAKYKQSTDKQVEVYSDCGLEDLIFEVKDEIDFYHFFPDFKEDRHQNSSEQPLQVAYCLQKNNIPKKQSLQVNDITATELYLTNNSSDTISAHISMNMSKYIDYLSFIDSPPIMIDCKKTIKIAAHTTEMLTFPFRIVNYTEQIVFPSVEIKTSDEKKIVKYIPQKPSCIWLAETELIGTEYIKHLQNCGDLISSSNYMTFLTLTGQSGCGKSRLLTEIKAVCAAQRKKVVEIDADKEILSALRFVRKIVSNLEELPALSNREYKKVCRIIHENGTEKIYALHILYDEFFNPSEEREIVTEYLYSLLKDKNAYLLLDNVQNYDETIIEIISGIIKLSAKDTNSSGIVFAFNLNFLYEHTKPYNLFKILKSLPASNSGSAYFGEISGFSVHDAIQYLTACLNPSQLNNPDKIEYERCIRKIAETHGNNPFFLKNYILYLYQNNIIAKSKYTSFYIRNIHRFQNEIDKIPETVSALIEIREQSMLQTAFSQDNLKELYFKFIELLSFLKTMPPALYNKLIGDDVIKGNTEHLGFTTYDNNGDIVFAHIYYYRFFREKYSYTNIKDSLLEDFINKSEQLHLTRKMGCQIYIAKYLTNHLLPEDTETIIGNIVCRNIDYDFSRILFDIVCEIMLSMDIPTEIYIKTYKSITEMSLNRFGIDVSLKYHNIIFNEFMYNPIKYEQYLADLILILFEHITHLMGQWHAEQSLDINRKVTRVIKERFAKDKNYNTILARLYNFRLNAYNQLNDLQSAEEACAQAMNYATKAEDKSALIITLKNEGDIYYNIQNSCAYREKIAQCWNNAYDAYRQYYNQKDAEGSDLALKLTVYIKGALGDMICCNFETAGEKIKYLSTYINRTEMMYFEEKIRMVIAEYNILTHTADEYSEQLIKQAIDICALYGNQNSYIDCFYMLAVLCMYQGNLELSLDNYNKVYTMIMQEIGDSMKIKRFNYFFIDMAIAIRRASHNTDFNKSFVLSLPQELKKKIDNILHMSDGDFKNYLAKDGRLTPIYDNQYNLNFPKI